MTANPRSLIRSWALTKSFGTGPSKSNTLVASLYDKVAVLTHKNFREQTLGATLDWGAKNFSYLVPESLQAVSALYLKIDVPPVECLNHAEQCT